jgi:hypothetical protein
LTIADCRLPIDGLVIEGLMIGLMIGESIAELTSADSRRRRPSDRSVNRRSTRHAPIGNRQSPIGNRQSAIGNRQSAIGNPIDNRQSNRQSAIGDPSIGSLQSAIGNRSWVS